MNKMILSALLVLSASTSFATTRPLYCGELTTTQNCDMDYCRISIKTEVEGAEHIVRIGNLLKVDGTPMNFSEAIDHTGAIICVTPTNSPVNVDANDASPMRSFIAEAIITY